MYIYICCILDSVVKLQMILLSEPYHVRGISQVVKDGCIERIIIAESVTGLIHPHQSVVVILLQVCQPTQLKTVIC